MPRGYQPTPYSRPTLDIPETHFHRDYDSDAVPSFKR